MADNIYRGRVKLVIGERRDQHMIDADWTDESGRIITEPEKKLG